MNEKHYRQLLLDKEAELTGEIARKQSDGRNSRDAEVQDPIDEVNASESKAVAFAEATMEQDTLTQVRDALARLDAGTYGKCQICGKQIEPARLEAVPWTPYCMADATKLERSAAGSGAADEDAS